MSRSIGHRAVPAWPALGRAVLALAALAATARAQSESDEAEVVASEPASHVSPLARFGVAGLSRRLESERLGERLQALERLGELGSAAALSRLTSYAVERRPRLVGREWLALARTLAPGAGDAKVQLALAMLLNQADSPSAGPDEAAALDLARGSAALALAADGGSGALLVLGRALRARGAPARAAAAALIAHPPRELDPLIEPGPPSVELATLLGALGEERAFHALRGWVRSGADDSVRAAAALALTRLGHLETIPLAAHWLEAGPGELAEAGLDILLAAHDARADAVLSARLRAERVSDADRRRLLDAASPALADAALAAVAGEGSSDHWRWALLGRIGGEAAARRLAQALADPRSAFAAAQVLSRLPGDAARAELDAALVGHVAFPLGVRASAARAQRFDEPARGLAERVAEALASDVPAERAAGAWARALDGGEAAVAELRSGDEPRVLAASSHAYGSDERALLAMLSVLESAPPGRVRSAASACLATAIGRERASSALLWSLVAEAGPSRPLALRALAARDEPGLRAALPSLLADPDPLLRAHVARGLGDAAQPSGVGLLVAQLAIETDEDVRHAIVIALGAQRGRAVSTWLARSARLDPSRRVRSAARLALAGVSLADPPPGGESLWLELHAAPPSAAVLVQVAPGLAIPALADPAGVVVVTGLPTAEVGIRLQ